MQSTVAAYGATLSPCSRQHARPAEWASAEAKDDGAELHALVARKVSKRFHLREPIGRGSTGVVYRARRRCDITEVAMKVIHQNQKLSGLVREEYERLRAIEHPNIIGAFDLLVGSSITILVMEYAKGLQLSRVIGQAPGSPLREVSARELCKMLVHGLQHMHCMGMVHGNVTPLEIIVTEDFSQLKLIDLCPPFRSCGLEGQPTGGHVRDQVYIAPEVLLGEPASMTSDVWQVGFCLFYMLAGKVPQERDPVGRPKDSYLPMIRCHISLQEPRISHVSEPCKSTLQHCLAVDKNERPTAEALLEKRWVRGWNKCDPPLMPEAAESPGRRSLGAAESPGRYSLTNCLLLPGLEPASPKKVSRPSSAKPTSRHSRKAAFITVGPDKLIPPASQVSTVPSSCSSLPGGASAASLDLGEQAGGVQALEEQQVLKPRTEIGKVLLANAMEGTYTVRLNDASVHLFKAEEVHATTAVEILRPKREIVKVLLVNRVEDTYKVRLADGSTAIVKAEDVEGDPVSCEEDTKYVEIVRPHKPKMQPA